MTFSRFFSAFSFVFLSVFFALPSAFAFNSDSLVAEFQKSDWEAHLLTDKELARFRDEASFQELLSMVNNNGIHWTTRIRMIRFMGELGTEKAAALLVDMFNDPFFNRECPSIKSYVATALGGCRGFYVVNALISGISDREVLVREAAIQSLYRIGDARAVPHLIGALGDKSDAVKLKAISALGRIGDSSAIPHLEGMAYKTEDPIIKSLALLALQGMSEEGR